MVLKEKQKKEEFKKNLKKIHECVMILCIVKRAFRFYKQL
jgi:hypothetical protein